MCRPGEWRPSGALAQELDRLRARAPRRAFESSPNASRPAAAAAAGKAEQQQQQRRQQQKHAAKAKVPPM